MSFTGNAPIRRARNLLLGGNGYRSRLLLNLDDPNNGRDAATGTIFQIEDAGNPSAGIYVPGGRFLQGYDANGAAGWSGSRGLLSVVALRAWDVASDTGDFQLSFWFQCQTVPPLVGCQTVTLNEEPFDANNFIAASIGTNAALNAIRLRFSTSQSNNFIVSCYMDIPYDANWHFGVLARIDDEHYACIDGLAPSATSTMTVGYRRSPGARTVLIGSNGNTRQADAIVDAIWLVDGSPYDVVNGFAVPTTAPVLY